MSRLEEKATQAVEDYESSFTITPLDFPSLARQQPPPRKWVVRDWIPKGHVTLLSGRGGVGKSLLAQQLGTAVAAAKDWIGDLPTAGPVIGLFCEDDHDELWRRQVDICQAFDVALEGVGQWLTYDARAGKRNCLTYPDAKAGVVEAPLMQAIRQQLDKTPGVQLLILDNVSQMFGGGDGGENEKSKVVVFVNMLTRIALDYDIGVLLLAHPAKADASEFSGSVAWDTAVRSRLFLSRESDEPNSRVILRRPKANYSNRDGQIAFAWERGAFIRADGRLSATDQAVIATRQHEAETAVLSALDWLAERKLSASHKTRAGNYLPKQMKANSLTEGFSTAELAEALTRLIGDQRLEVDAFLWTDGNRNRVQGLKRPG